MERIALIIAYEGFQEVEYAHTRAAVEEAGINVQVASDQVGVAHSANHELSVSVDVLVEDIVLGAHDGVFLIGGPGALEHLDTNAVKKLLQRAYEQGLWIGAICISPRILLKAGLLDGKRMTGWNDDKVLTALAPVYGAEYLEQPVIIEDRIITAEGPAAATLFGRAIAEVLAIERSL